MQVMQYEIGLPADYDMGIIDRRVAERGKATDDYPHLGVKAYAVRQAGRYGSTVNTYAPFYFWAGPAGLNSFLYGPFRSITTDFGRPPVRQWIGAAFHRGPGFAGTPVFATRALSLLPQDVEPGPALDVTARGIVDGVHSQAVAVNTERWEVVRFTLWNEVPADIDGNSIAYDILHVSRPELSDLPTGQLW